MDVSASTRVVTSTTMGGGGGGLSIVPPTKSPEAESETPARIPPTKPIPFTNGVLKRHAPPIVVYKECLKNHAASLGGHALDGCGEFMPSPTATASDPTSLKCAACGCHRNFHRREPEELTVTGTSTPLTHVIEYHPHHRHHPLPPPSSHPQTAPTQVVGSSRGVRSPGSQSPPPISSTYYPGSAPHMLLALSSGVGGAGGGTDVTPATNGPIHHPHQQHHHHPHSHHHPHNLMNSSSTNPSSRKRFRTKFSQDQKDRMYEFAEKVGWKMLKGNEDLVNGFCNEIGVERSVFKVWMHNNKNTFGKRTNTTGVITTTGSDTPANIASTTLAHHHSLNTTGANTSTNNNDSSNRIDDDEDEEHELGNLNGNGGNSNNSSSINNSNHSSHHHTINHNHQQQQLYNGGGKSNAPTNASSSSS